MIRREAFIWSNLSHLNVLRCLGFSNHHDRFALVSPWMERGTILQYIESNTSPEHVDVLEIVSTSTLSIVIHLIHNS
jgi:serine/threonine protein kinase